MKNYYRIVQLENKFNNIYNSMPAFPSSAIILSVFLCFFLPPVGIFLIYKTHKEFKNKKKAWEERLEKEVPPIVEELKDLI